MQITAELVHARVLPTTSGEEYITGLIVGDSKQRWRDGTRIYTSKIVAVHPDNVYENRNSIYKVTSFDE